MCSLHLVLGDKQIRRQDWDNRPLPGKERRKGGTGHTAEPRLLPQDRVFLKSGSRGEWAWEDHGQRLRGREKRLWNGQMKLGRRSWKNGSSESKSGISKEWRRGSQGLGRIWAPRHPWPPGTCSLYQTTDVANGVFGKSDIHDFVSSKLTFG